MIRFGSACLNLTMGRQGGFRHMIKRTWEREGISWASRLAVENTENLCKIIEWNNRNGIGLYRMTSDLLPWASEYEIDTLPDWRTIRANLEMAGKIAKRGGQRLTFHPGQFNCLTSPREKVVLNCIRDLRIHGEIMDAMGLPQTREAKINIHMGGSFGDKASAIDRWCQNYEFLPQSVKARITLENDDKGALFNVEDLLVVHQRLGVPIVFDVHHFEVARNNGDMKYEEAFELSLLTWPNGIRPVFHLSNSAKNTEGKAVAPSAHSDYIHSPMNHLNADIDVVIEAKAKELAVFDYIKKFGNNQQLAA